MVSGEHGADAYLAAWRREGVPCGDDLEAEATAAAARIESYFDQARLAQLVKSGGRAG